MTETPPQSPPAPPGDGPPFDPPQSGWNTENLKDYRLLRRSRSDRKLGGVAGGLARHLDVDPTVVRVLLVVLVFFGGAGLLVYGVLWLLVPDEGTGRATIGFGDSTRNVLVISALVLGAICAVSAWNGVSDVWPLALIAIVLFAVMLSRDRRRAPQPPVPPGASSPPGGTLPPTAWTPPPASPAPTDPRRTGPLLFGPVLAVLALVLGAMGMFDVAGADVPDSAYPAAVLGVVGLALVVGAFVGRAGGLILLGLLATAMVGGAAIANPSYGGDRDLVVRPTSAVELADGYSVPAGRVELDLRDLDDPASIDGRSIKVDVNVGEIVVIVPADMTVSFDAAIDGGGLIESPDGVREGWEPALSGVLDSRRATPSAEVDLDLDLHFGHIELRQS